MKALRQGLLLAGLAGVGLAGYKVVEKSKQFKVDYDVPVVFGGKDEKVVGDFDSISYGVLCGGLNLNLLEAEMVGDEATLEINAEFSGVSITVPEDWNVKAEGIAEKGGESIRTKFDEEDTESKRLYIKYNVKFGGIEIKHATVEVPEEEEVIDVDLVDDFEDLVEDPDMVTE